MQQTPTAGRTRRVEELSCGNYVALGFVVLSCLLWVGCSGPVPEPFLGCVDDLQCANGRCVAGLCVPNITVDAALDGQQLDIATNDSTYDAGPSPCTSDDECPPTTSACLAPTCNDGVCGVVPLQAEVTCTTTGICPAPGVCGAAGSCQPEGAPCDDGNPCTADQCIETGCNHVTFSNDTPCNLDGLACTDEACFDGVCAPSIADGWCLVAGVCAKENEGAAGDPCRICSPSNSTKSWSLKKSGTCEDNDPCTIDTVCNASGDCVGAPRNCDDKNLCTDDICSSVSGCINLSNAATCTDTNPCTEEGFCADGACEFKTTLDCDDGNPCTKDSCATGFGCFHAPHEANCIADADPCTDDVCISGACVAVPSVSVCKVGGTCIPAGGKASGNPCLVCKPELSSTKWTTLHNVACQDGNLCTVFDGCVQGQCLGEKVVCNDGSPCTKDACDAQKGCIFEPIGGECTDGDACTIKDACVAGVCKGIALTPADCTDNNPCTADACIAIAGCSHKPHNDPCDDGDACTKGDFCNAGSCAAGKLVCPCEFNGDCDDNNPCTIDTCVSGVGCSNVAKANNSTCDDGDACTKGDACKETLCSGVDTNCNDNNPCTDDACSPKVGCVHKPLQGNTCIDGDACTSADLCVDGTCMGTPKACDDGKSCTLDGCNKTTGGCSHTQAADATPCPDDGVSCTLDRCVKGVCNHTGVASNFCLIQGTCLSGGAMHPAKQCLGCQPKTKQNGWAIFPGQPCNDGNACSEKTTCQTDGSCKGSTKTCNDSNPCTLDACNPQSPGGVPCVHTPSSGNCDDGSDCTTKDICSKNTCKGTLIVCDDGDVCTDDSCQVSGGCVFQPTANGKKCADDGLKCTDDRCIGGMCQHTVNKGWCAISTGCYSDGSTLNGIPCLGCEATKQPKGWTQLTGGKCDDGDPCTGADTCAAGTCKGDKAKACDDNNACTIDSCSALAGCSHKATSGPCNDGNPCTKQDKCVGSKCVAGPPLQCSTSQTDEKACLVHLCLPSKGGCAKVSTCGSMHACVSGLCLTKPAGKPPGPVTLPIPIGMASQPLRPTIAWQESHEGLLGAVPQLWVVAQTAGCSPSLGVYSNVMTVQLPPSAASPVFQVLKTNAPTGGKAWCAAHPTLSAHPTTYDVLALSWLEGGNEKSPCPWAQHGGRSRVALVGVKGDATVMTAGAACPASGLLAPLPWRAAMVLHSAQGSIDKTSPGQLSGVMVRPSAAGGLTSWTGDVVSAWGGTKAKVLPKAKLNGWNESPVKARATMSSWTSGQVLWAPTSFTNAKGQTIPALTATHVHGPTGVANTRQVVLTGAPISGVATYDAVEAVYDSSTKRVAVLISGRATFAGKTKSFLAFSRIHPDQGAVPAPAAIAVVELTAGQGPIQSFRIARLPNSDRFLMLWAAPGSTVLKALRIEPKDDFTFNVTSIGAVASDFVSHPIASGVDSSGGLSELRVDPAGNRYSIAYEGVGTLSLLTAALPPAK